MSKWAGNAQVKEYAKQSITHPFPRKATAQRWTQRRCYPRHPEITKAP